MRGNAWSGGAEEFDALVSGGAGDAEAHAELLELVAALRAVPPVTARPEFVASLRTQLVAAAEREPERAEQALAARLTPRQRRGSRERRLAAVIGGFAVVSATGSMAMASQDALPGDVLYPVKRAIENAQTNLQSDGAAKADALISHADARLRELESLVSRGASADAVNVTLQDFTDQARQASEFALDDYAATGKADRIADLRAFAGDSMDVLAGLGQVIATDSRPSLITASQTVRQIDAAAWEACPSCAEGGVAEVPDFAALPLSAVLTGNVTASVTDVAPMVPEATTPSSPPPSKGPESNPTGIPPLPPVDLPKPPDPTKTPKPSNPIGETVDNVTRNLTGTLGIDGGSQTTDGTTTDPGLVPNLVDGVTGILGGLLGSK
ncbi:DUF5667 domain-containing protein [Nocardioides nitrophenolicus]|uniref:DUF5667 domain-containing protein n=1 Tax=Nocardioides nitrophenolicus TaxID=60489 RepID=UPI001EF7619B|nr:DUF5667 domain-containing protein [Nocardioides nitrophenolicus]